MFFRDLVDVLKIGNKYITYTSFIGAPPNQEF